LDVERGVGQLLEFLPLCERLLRYRQFSQDALQKAADITDSEMRAGYLSMAAGWHMLATEIERFTNRQRLSGEASLAPNPAAVGPSPEDAHKNGF
jgi:hypothetical protein